MNTTGNSASTEAFENITEMSVKHRSRYLIIAGEVFEHILLFFKNYYIITAFAVLVSFAPLIFKKIFVKINLSNASEIVLTDDEKISIIEKIQRSTSIIDKKLLAKTPSSHYLVINSSSNIFSLYKGTELVKTDKCSTGSYVLLKNSKNQQWMFKTPKGEFKIKGKHTDPVWKKPDWAFVEEGLPVPSANHESRYEYGVLGDYSLHLGQGYMIHGTLYQRFLGLPVTHGCIRLNDANLKLVYISLNQGSKVYIY